MYDSPGQIVNPDVGSGAGRSVAPDIVPGEPGRVEPAGRGSPWWKSWWRSRTRAFDKRGGILPARKLNAVEDDSGLNERIIAHSDATQVRELVAFLVPHGWRVHYDVEASRLEREIVFHAETTRRRALDQLCLSLGLKGIFYPYKRLVLIVEGRSR